MLSAGVLAALGAAGAGAPAASADPAEVVDADPEVVTVQGAIRGTPFALATSGLDDGEFARRARINAQAFRQAWLQAIEKLRVVPPAEVSPESGLATVSHPNSGVILRVPPGYYAINTWDMSVTPADLHLPGPEGPGHQYGEWSLRITVEAEGAVLVAKDHTGWSADGKPVVYLGSPSSPGFSRDLVKRVTIRGLSIQSDDNPIQSSYASDRVALLIHQAQEITLERVSIYGFRREGLRLEGVMDSTFKSVNIGWCAKAVEPNDSPYALALITTRNGSGDPVENCNALRFIGCHIEFCELELLIDRGTRHVDFLASKFEHGWATQSVVSPVQIGNPVGAAGSSLEHVLEISFLSCMFVQNSYGSEGAHPSHIAVEEVGYVGSQSERAKTAISFVSCHFTVPDGGGERWFSGADTTFTSCDFNGCGNAEGELPCFDLGNDVAFATCRFSMVRVIHDGLTNDPGTGGGGAALQQTRADLFRFHGSASRVLHPVIYFPPRTDGVWAAPGVLATIAEGAGDGNELSGWLPHWYGLPSATDGGPGHIEPIRYENSQRFHLLSTLLLEPWSNAVGNPVAPNAEGVVSVAGRKMMKLQSDRIYTRLADGYAGQIIHIVSDGGTISLGSGAVIPRSTGPITIGPGALRSFVLYQEGPNAAWFEL